MAEGTEKRNSEYKFCAVYGEKEGEVWETDLREVRDQFIDSLERWQSVNGTNSPFESTNSPFENGKIDLPKLFDSGHQGNFNLERNVLSNATDHLTDVFYLYDTIMVLHFIKEWEKQEDKSKVPLLSYEYIDAVHKIIQIKWFACLATIILCNASLKIDRMPIYYLWEHYVIFLILIDYPFKEDFPDMDIPFAIRDFPFPSLDPPYPYREYFDKIFDNIYKQNREFFVTHINKPLKYINNWQNDLIVRLLSFEEGALKESKELLNNNKFDDAIISCFETEPSSSYEEPSEDLFLINLWTKIKNQLDKNEKLKDIKSKCVAITGVDQNKNIMYAISGIEIDRKDKNEVCEIIENKIKEEHNSEDLTIVHCRLFNNSDVLYITRDGKREISFERDVKDKIKANYELDKNNEILKNFKLSYGRMFSCSERKLFSVIGKEKAFVFTSRPNCELCLTVHDKKEEYSQIELLYPGKSPANHLKYDPIANEFLDNIN